MMEQQASEPSDWSWLADTYSYVPEESLPALRLDPSENTLAWVVDQTVWHITGCQAVLAIRVGIRCRSWDSPCLRCSKGPSLRRKRSDPDQASRFPGLSSTFTARFQNEVTQISSWSSSPPSFWILSQTLNRT